MRGKGGITEFIKYILILIFLEIQIKIPIFLYLTRLSRSCTLHAPSCSHLIHTSCCLIISSDSVPNPWCRWGPFGMVIQRVYSPAWWLQGNVFGPGSASVRVPVIYAQAHKLSQHLPALWNVAWSLDSIQGTKMIKKKYEKSNLENFLNNSFEFNNSPLFSLLKISSRRLKKTTNIFRNSIIHFLFHMSSLFHF